MHCPRDKIVLNSINLKDVQIDICPLCHGVWINTDELQRVLEIYRTELKPVDTDGNWLKFIQTEIMTGTDTKVKKLWDSEINCPICGKLMQKSQFAVMSDTVIDSCREGCGIWLDKDEIIRIADFLATAEKPLTDIQKAQVKERLRTFSEANKLKDSPLQFSNLRQYSQTELEKDLEATPAGQYVSIVRMVIQGLLYFLLRRL
jgi:Zn-finger nucleic acid-binding protein